MAAKNGVPDPDANPSNPSAMFTPLEELATRRKIQAMNRPMPIVLPQKNKSIGRSRNSEMWVEAGVRPLESGN